MVSVMDIDKAVAGHSTQINMLWGQCTATKRFSIRGIYDPPTRLADVCERAMDAPGCARCSGAEDTGGESWRPEVRVYSGHVFRVPSRGPTMAETEPSLTL